MKAPSYRGAAPALHVLLGEIKGKPATLSRDHQSQHINSYVRDNISGAVRTRD